MTLHQALTAIRAAINDRINALYTSKSGITNTKVSNDIFNSRVKAIFDSLSYADQIEVSNIYPAFFYDMLTDDQLATRTLIG